VLLDNMSVEMVARAVERLRASGSKSELEVSGGITLENLAAFARTGVTRISIGALTHSAPSADLSFAVCPL
jgi:nicotinate-nucleotide pyrophosphorylase (carboxylating)